MIPEFTDFWRDSRFHHPFLHCTWALRVTPSPRVWARRCPSAAGKEAGRLPPCQSHGERIHPSPFPDDFQNIVIMFFRLTFLRREQRCFPRVWTAFYPPLQTWCRGKAAGQCGSSCLCSPAEAAPLGMGGSDCRGSPNSPKQCPLLSCRHLWLVWLKEMISAVPSLYGAQSPVHCIYRLYVNKRLTCLSGYSC